MTIINCLMPRTDSGVHAASTAACVDLQRSEVSGNFFFHPKHITVRLNDFLTRAGIDIRCVSSFYQI